MKPQSGTEESEVSLQSSDSMSKEEFSRYRPTFHVIARQAFMNDPCGAAYIEETGDYLLCYQLGSNVDSFADAWGCCTSKDLVHWKDWPEPIVPGPCAYDKLKVFSGSIFAQKKSNKTILYLYYTSIRHLPIHWTKEYEVGCESQSLAVSRDLGKTWQKSPSNPLLLKPATGLATTGWRDPFVSHWSAMSRLLDLPEDTVYMLISSGTKDHGPRLVLYRSSDLIAWVEIGPIFSPQATEKFHADSELNYGHNLECGSFFSLDGREYLVFGVEAGNDTDRHAMRWTMWLAGDLVMSDSGLPVFRPLSAGTADHDILYAVHMTTDKHGELVQYGWLDEDDNSRQHSQKWAGCHSLPRTFSTLTLPLSQTLQHKDEWLIDEAEETMTTLAIRPVETTTLLRKSATVHTDFTKVQSKCFEFSASFTQPAIDRIIFAFRISSSGHEKTRLIINLEQHTITLDRSQSSSNNGNSTSRTAHFQVLEKVLHLRVYCDNSVVEVFANDRFCMSSRIYPDPSSLGVALDFEGDQTHIASLQYEATLYDGLSNAWPDREAL